MSASVFLWPTYMQFKSFETLICFIPSTNSIENRLDRNSFPLTIIFEHSGNWCWKLGSDERIFKSFHYTASNKKSMSIWFNVLTAITFFFVLYMTSHPRGIPYTRRHDSGQAALSVEKDGTRESCLCTFDLKVETSGTTEKTPVHRLFERRAVWVKNDESRYYILWYADNCRKIGWKRRGSLTIVLKRSMEGQVFFISVEHLSSMYLYISTP